MTELERLAAATLLPAFEGLEPPDWLRRAIADGLGGVVLFSRNVRDPEQVGALTRALRAERPDLLVAVDEEGGDVTRLEVADGSSYPGNRALGVVDDVALTQRVASALGADLVRAGVTLDLAPVADVDASPSSPIVGVRSFGSDAELVARHVAAFVSGLQRAGIAACAKHFPGHGATAADSHAELPRIEVTDDALLPFRAAIAAGVKAVMTGHLGVGAEPASLSHEVTDGLLRARLGFAGLVVTDALEMRALSATLGVEEAAVRALAAGADALCLGRDLDVDAVERVRRAVVAAVVSERLAEERLREAAERVAAVGAWAARAPAESAVPRLAGLDAARRAVSAEGDIALTRSPLVLELLPPPSMAADEPRHGLAPLLGAAVVRGGRAPDGDPRQLVLVIRDAHRHAWQREAVARAVDRVPDAIVVETGIPLWRPRGAVGYIATYGAARVNLTAAAELLRGTRR